MKQIHKNPTLYYILVPVAAALWSLFLWGLYLPQAERGWRVEKTQYDKAQQIIAEILALDSERLEFTDSKSGAAEFDYAVAVEKVATLCKISSANYKLSSGIIITTGGQKSQSAAVVLREVDISRFAKFLSTIQLRWANLQCTGVKLDRRKGAPDSWDADLDFTYYY
jgi:hypothetical protein